MRATSLGRGLSLALLPLALAATLAACGGEPQGTTGAWRYDEDASAKRVGDSVNGIAIMKRKFAGMVGALEFHRDNTYHLTITGGPAPTEQTGTFKAGNGEMVLNPKIVDGQTVNPTEAEVHIHAPDAKHLEVILKGFTAVFTPAPPPGPAPAPAPAPAK